MSVAAAAGGTVFAARFRFMLVPMLMGARVFVVMLVDVCMAVLMIVPMAVRMRVSRELRVLMPAATVGFTLLLAGQLCRTPAGVSMPTLL